MERLLWSQLKLNKDTKGSRLKLLKEVNTSKMYYEIRRNAASINVKTEQKR